MRYFLFKIEKTPNSSFPVRFIKLSANENDRVLEEWRIDGNEFINSWFPSNIDEHLLSKINTFIYSMEIKSQILQFIINGRTVAIKKFIKYILFNFLILIIIIFTIIRNKGTKNNNQFIGPLSSLKKIDVAFHLQEYMNPNKESEISGRSKLLQFQREGCEQ
jgi:hypothetical protein